MQFDLPTDPTELCGYLPRFRELVGAKQWDKRFAQLCRDEQSSLPQSKIAFDYHWLEIALGWRLDRSIENQEITLPIDLDEFAAMQFAGMVLEVYERLSTPGRTTLAGRLRSALSAETGFAALFLEMEMARRLLATGCNVEFADLEKIGQFDLQFSNGALLGEIECKSMSADAGRKIHRKDFYRFIDAIEPMLERKAEMGSRKILVVTLHDRLPSNVAKQRILREAITRICESSIDSIEGDFFSVRRAEYSASFGTVPPADQRVFYHECRKIFGHDIHVTGPFSSNGGACIIVMRSLLEDDSSKPWLEAMQKAASQFSGAKPGFIAVQFNDLAPSELVAPHFRWRAELLSGGVFRREGASHVVATFICPYRGLVQFGNGVGAPAFAILNPWNRFSQSLTDYPFLTDDIPDDRFAHMIGAKPQESE